ncbi:GNAT family N-acetyltransferase [Schlesneria paludicola]|uniref:GNAT family N-acetyltransferase n=1 Tax=Schlesneria paludicola TaxID=360056 RepID=UPI00029B0078|nr:GNAT family N-acetyltransferase [Schlesneria paludicola]
MISPIDEGDLDQLSNLVDVTVHGSVANNKEDAKFLIEDIVRSLKTWQASCSRGFHAKYSVDEAIVGFVVVKEYWNLSHLFVLPSHQGHGIGRGLMQAALTACRDKSPRGKIQLHSSSNAVGFYATLGFNQTGAGIERPGGCIPFEFGFSQFHATGAVDPDGCN